jgi:hypothetical protein
MYYGSPKSEVKAEEAALLPHHTAFASMVPCHSLASHGYTSWFTKIAPTQR